MWFLRVYARRTRWGDERVFQGWLGQERAMTSRLRSWKWQLVHGRQTRTGSPNLSRGLVFPRRRAFPSSSGYIRLIADILVSLRGPSAGRRFSSYLLLYLYFFIRTASDVAHSQRQPLIVAPARLTTATTDSCVHGSNSGPRLTSHTSS